MEVLPEKGSFSPPMSRRWDATDKMMNIGAKGQHQKEEQEPQLNALNHPKTHVLTFRALKAKTGLHEVQLWYHEEENIEASKNFNTC